MLEQFRHKIEFYVLEHQTKYYEHCQKYEQSPNQFSFIIIDDIEFNYNIIVDILYIERKPVLYLVDKVTCFHIERWLKDISAKYVLDQL